MLKEQMIIKRNFITYGIVGMPTGLKMNGLDLHIGDKVLVHNVRKDQKYQGYVVLIGSNITITGFNNIPISRLKILEIKESFKHLKANDSIHEDLTITRIKY